MPVESRASAAHPPRGSIYAVASLRSGTSRRAPDNVPGRRRPQPRSGARAWRPAGRFASAAAPGRNSSAERFAGNGIPSEFCGRLPPQPPSLEKLTALTGRACAAPRYPARLCRNARLTGSFRSLRDQTEALVKGAGSRAGGPARRLLRERTRNSIFMCKLSGQPNMGSRR